MPKNETPAPVGMVVKNLPVKAAVVQLEKNARKDYSQVPKLRSDIERDGRLLQPVVGCENADGSWTLYAGFCRYEAVSGLGWETIPVNVIPQLADKERALLNGRENVARDNFTSYDKARWLTDLHETYKMSQKDISQALSGDTTLNAKNVANYIRACQSLHPDILKAWQEKHPLCSTMRLFSMLKYEQEQQPKLFNQMVEAEKVSLEASGVDPNLIQGIIDNPYDVARYEKALAGKGGRGKKGSSVQLGPDGKPVEKKKKQSRPDTEIATMVVGWLRDGMDGLDESVANGVIRGIQWATGNLPVLSVGDVTIYDPEADKERKEKEKARIKAQQDAEKAQKALAEANKKLAEAGLPPVSV